MRTASGPTRKGTIHRKTNKNDNDNDDNYSILY